MKKNKKGFTLVELLAAIAILGTITIISLPQINKLISKNKETKYEKYAETLIAASKLYTDSYSKDMFGHNVVGCQDVFFTDLSAKGLISDIKVDGETCENSKTFVRVTKNNNNYQYSYSIVCTKTDGSAETYNHTPISNGGTCKGASDKDGPEINIVLNDKLKQKVEDGKWAIGGNADEYVEVQILDNSGLLENTKIKYAWSTNFDSASIKGTDYIEYDFENKRNQGIKTEPPEDSTPISLKIGIPKNITGQYYLHVIPVQVYDSLGNTYIEPDGGLTKPMIKIDNSKPTTPTIFLSHTSETAENVTFTITPGIDSQSGVNKTEYKIGNDSWNEYNDNRITLLNDTGVQDVSARTIDYAGNISNTTSKIGKCDKDAVIVNRKDNKAGGFRLTLGLKYSPSGIISNKYEYAYWKIESTNDTNNNQSGQVESKCGKEPPSSATKKTTTKGYTDYIPQNYSRQYYCFAVRPYRSKEISELNRWTIQRKHAQGATD